MTEPMTETVSTRFKVLWAVMAFGLLLLQAIFLYSERDTSARPPVVSQRVVIPVTPYVRMVDDGGSSLTIEELDGNMRPVKTWRMDKSVFADAWVAAR